MEDRKRGTNCIILFNLLHEKTVLNFEEVSKFQNFMIFIDMIYRIMKFFKINFSENTIFKFLHCFFHIFDFSGPIVVRHIADETERVNNIQFLKYLSSHDSKVYLECLWRELVLVLFAIFAHSKTCVNQVILPNISLS